MLTTTPFGQLEARRAQLDAATENQARSSRTSLTYTTTGTGELTITTHLDLQNRFVEEPAFTCGFALDVSTPLVSGYFPRVGAGVREWVVDATGCYIGAYLCFTVDIGGSGSSTLSSTPTAAPTGTTTTYDEALQALSATEAMLKFIMNEPSYVIHHHLVFEGKAIKNLPSHLVDF